MFEALKDLPKEPLLYEAGGIVFASALLGFAHVMRSLLRTVGRGGLWMLPMLGALLVLAAVILHGYANYMLMPLVSSETPDVLRQVYRWRFIALMAMLLASVLTLAGSGGLWLIFTGAKGKGASK